MNQPTTETTGYGQQTPFDGDTKLNAIMFACRQIVAELDTMKLVKVVAVTGGGLAPAGTVDVLPLVNQIDGNGNPTKHGVVHNVPWSRVQGGPNAVICDPQVGDFGYVVCADRDISKALADKAQTNPGSLRKYSVSDGVYAGGLVNGAPTQYLIFTAGGLQLVDKSGNSVAMSASGTVVTDANGNSVRMTAAGMTLIDKNANQIQMAAGFVNVVTPVFKVNGVPVTVP